MKWITSYLINIENWKRAKKEIRQFDHQLIRLLISEGNRPHIEFNKSFPYTWQEHIYLSWVEFRVDLQTQYTRSHFSTLYYKFISFVLYSDSDFYIEIHTIHHVDVNVNVKLIRLFSGQSHPKWVKEKYERDQTLITTTTFKRTKWKFPFTKKKNV